MALALAATDVDLVADVLDCDIDDFDVIEALDLDLSSADDKQVDDLDCGIFCFDVIKALDLDLSSADDYLVDGIHFHVLDDLDFHILEALALGLSSHDDKFRGGACYAAIFSDADIVSHCRHTCEYGDDFGDRGAAAAVCAWLLAGVCDDDCDDGAEEEEAGSSPSAASGVTDDGPLTPAAGDAAAAEAMSAYMAELERFLQNDDHNDEQAEDQGLLGVVEDYFAGDQLLATAEVVPAAGRAAEPTDGGVDENDNDLAAREDEQSDSRKRARYE